MTTRILGTPVAAALFAVALLAPSFADAKIDGIEGPSFHLSARTGYISTPDGGSVFMWGYANENAAPPAGQRLQYPGPTLVVAQGDTVTVTLTNWLEVPTSIVFPGFAVLASGGADGALAREAPAASGAVPGTVTYTFTAAQPGTYTYYSGTRPDLQVEMGLVGALIVRPRVAGVVRTDRAYRPASTTFAREYLFLLTEIDASIHYAMDPGTHPGLPAPVLASLVDTSRWWPSWWMINGRSAPDTMAPARAPWLPNQPYNAMPMVHPGDTILVRVVGGNRELHPFHTHGEHAHVIARDAQPLASVPGGAIDLVQRDFTLTVAPGQTTDALFTWTGNGLGWDIYGHKAGDARARGESADDHRKPFPVELPSDLEMANGDFYSGSPYLGGRDGLPPGVGLQNLGGEYTYMWHSHSEKEMTNFNVFPGGMMTMLMVMHPSDPIMED